MSGLAPQWALSAQAIDAAGDPHLAAGVHLRVFVPALMGLPIAPFRVVKVNLGQGGVNGSPRTDGIVWTDASDKVLTLPIQVTPNNPVKAWLPAPGQGTCCWIEILAEPGRLSATGAQTDPLALRCDAKIGGAHGAATIASALKKRYVMSASRIDHVVISGEGRITGATWIDAEKIGGVWGNAPWRLWSLPVPTASRYVNVADHAAQAQDRVKRGAPLRKPLYDDPAAAGPSTAALIPSPVPAETARIAGLSAKPQSWAKSLVTGSQPPYQLLDEMLFTDQNNKQPGTMKVNVLSSLLQSAVDPGMARYLGLSDVDTAPGNPGDVIVYLIRGIWQGNLMSVNNPNYLALFPAAAKKTTLAGNLPPGLAPPSAAAAPWWDLYAVACVTVGQATASPSAPQITQVAQAGWLPDPPPIARREIVVTAQNLSGAAGLAFVRTIPPSNHTVLNPKYNGTTVPLVASPPPDLPGDGNGRFYDRAATSAGATYRLAQADWFGRWSNWGQGAIGEGQRPRPPRPVVELTYQPPAYTQATIDNSLNGDLLIQAAVPKPAGLAPASWLIAKLEVTVNGVASTVSVPNPASPPDFISTSVKGPPLARAGKALATVTAKWINTDNKPSDASDAVQRKLWDNRPPKTLDLLGDLFFTSRPDDRGKAVLDLQWTSAPGHKRYRVYTTDETALIAWLESTGNNLANQLKGLQKHGKAQNRGTLYANNKAIFPRELFELLTHDPIEAPSPGTTLKHRITLSGSLGVLTLVRIVAVSESNVDADFAGSPLLPYAVPNTPAPAQPMLEATPHPDLPRAVRLRLQVPLGVGKALTWRLRRSSAGGAVPMQMPIVQGGLMPPSEGDTHQTLIVDSNDNADPAAPTRLRDWHTYYWVAEVRGADEPGSSPAIPTAWSASSAPVSMTLVPADPPQPVGDVTVQNTGAKDEWQVRCKTPAPLRGGSAGRYQLDLYKKEPGDRERYVKSVFADAPVAAGGQDAQNEMHFIDQAPGGTSYRLVLRDPIGRPSAPSAAALTPTGA